MTDTDFSDHATRHDRAAEARAVIDELTANCAAERERGDSYFEQLLTAKVALTAEREAHAIWLARAAELGLTVERLTALLGKARNYWMDHLGNCHRVPGNVCSCGRNALLGDIDAALSAPAPAWMAADGAKETGT